MLLNDLLSYATLSSLLFGKFFYEQNDAVGYSLSFLLVKVIVHLVQALDSIKVSTARAMIICMMGEYNSCGHILPKMLTTVLKYLARCFPKEALETKLQILYAAVKVVSFKLFPFFCSLLLNTQVNPQLFSPSTLEYQV